MESLTVTGTTGDERYAAAMVENIEAKDKVCRESISGGWH